MNSIGINISSLGGDEAEEEQRKATSTATSPEGENMDGEGGVLKIISALQIRPSSLNLIETKKSVPSHVIVVVVKHLLFINRL